MKKTKFVLYIGANDGTICLPLAEKNKDLFIHAFEPNPALVKKIKLLKKKIELLKIFINLVTFNYFNIFNFIFFNINYSRSTLFFNYFTKK